MLQLLLFFIFLSRTITICSIDLYNRDLQTAIILFTLNMSSHKTDWIIFELPLLALSCLLYHFLCSLMNELDGECLCLWEISINVNKFLAVLLLLIYLFIRFLNTALCCSLFTSLSLSLDWCCCCLFTSFFPFLLHWYCCYIFVYSLVM